MAREVVRIVGDSNEHAEVHAESDALQTVPGPVKASNVVFEDTSFVTGDSPATHDVNAALGRNSIAGYIANDGAGDFTVDISRDGISFDAAFTMKFKEVVCLDHMSIDKIRITWSANSSYRINLI